jgi:uncharacterized membrane protein YphA (DoxX/SURF4 family)
VSSNPFVQMWEWIDRPVSVLRIEIVRIFTPLFILGFMSGRLAHADEWIGDAGFRVPDLEGDPRQPLYIPPLPSWAAWSIAGMMVASGLSVALGFRTRKAAVVFASTLAFVALSDRLAAFTVSKLSPVLMIAVASGPAGARLGIDAWWKRRRGGKRPKKRRPVGAVRFVQVLMPVFYNASGLAKAFGDWLKVPHLLWTHLHDSYQTALTFALASVTPGWVWNILQGLVVTFELFAPVWFGLDRTRTYALVFGLGMHAMIGLLFGPVIWFSLLMMALLIAAYLPERGLEPLERLATWLEKRPARTVEDPDLKES